MKEAHLPHADQLGMRHNRRVADKIEDLVKRIGARLYETGLSEREASIQATGKPDAIRYIRMRRAMPSAERLALIAETLGTTPEWLLGRVDKSAPVEPTKRATRLADFRRLPKDLPVYGTALGADLDFSILEGEHVAIEQTEVNMVDAMDWMGRPSGLAGRRDVYVVTVVGYSMLPRFDPGRRILVNPSIQPRVGDDVVVQLKRPVGDDGDAEISAVLIKQLVRRRADALVLYQFNPEATFEVSMSKVHAIHRIMPWDDALGM